MERNEFANRTCRNLRLMYVAPLELPLGSSARILLHSDIQPECVYKMVFVFYNRAHNVPPSDKNSGMPWHIEGVRSWRNIPITRFELWPEVGAILGERYRPGFGN
jgi:hypothetical protein